MMRNIVAAIVLLSLSACTTVQPIAPPQVQRESKHIFDKSYRLGEEKAVYVGDAMIRVKDYYELTSTADLLSATESYHMSIPPFMHIDVTAGSPARVLGTTSRDSRVYRVIVLDDQLTRGLKFLLNDDGTFEGSAINLGGDKMGWSYKPEPATVRYVTKTFTQIDKSKGSKNFEIVYSGTTKDGLNLLYREFTPEDMARPAFTQNLSYARDSNTIRFRDILVRVIDANNERIRYVVDQDGMPSG